MVIEEAKSKQKAKMVIGSHQNKNDQSSQPVDFSIQKNLSQETSQSTSCPSQQQSTQNMMTQQPQKSTQNIVNTCRDTVKPRKKETAPFTDSIPKGINMRNFNSSLRGGKPYMKAFAGAKSTQPNHYVRPTLDEFQYAAIIHVGINDILRSNSESDLKELPNNIMDSARTSRSYNIVKIFILSILPSRRTFINTKSIND